ncbi:Putative serine/threonine-protein kinase pknH [Minicystis rosea]|nr:Putative serine/threonine-protein kinase pknH [Minicystis rosea]
MSLLPGGLFHGRYRVIRCIKRGGMGAVFEVLDERTESRRALKVMHPDVIDDADLRGRFEQEARVTSAVESDHVVRVSDAAVDAATNTPFLVMELLRGSDLGAVIREAGRVAPGDVVRYLGQVALGLERAHAAGIVHRDLKPENLFLTRRDDGSPCVKVLDFGIAKIIARRSQAKDTRTMGTPVYMAPEQIRGEGTIGPAADVYALGHIAYALLVGEDYWNEEASRAGSMFSFFSRVVQGMPEAPSARAGRTRGVTLGAAFDAWLRRATAPRPEDRFAGAAAAVVTLAGALGVEAPPGLAIEADPTRGDLAPGFAGATTLTTDVDTRAPTSAVRAEDGLDTVPMSVWSQSATMVSTTGSRSDAMPMATARSSPIAPSRPPSRRIVGVFGAVVAAGALAWVAFGLGAARAPLPSGIASGARVPADAPSAMEVPSAATTPSASPPSASPVVPSSAPVVPTVAAASPSAVVPMNVTKPRARSTPVRPKPSSDPVVPAPEGPL